MFGRAFRWLRAIPPWLIANPISLAVVVTSLLGGSAAGVPAADGMYTYLWKDPRFCNDCHIHDYANEAFDRSVHSTLTTCHDCHRVPIRHYPWNLYLTIFNRPENAEEVTNPHLTVSICEQCHSSTGGDEPLTGPMSAEIRAQVVHIDKSEMHRRHLDAKERTPTVYQGGETPQGEGAIVCTDCHGGENLNVHQFPATAERCEVCHATMHPEDEQGAGLSCLDCHGPGFLGGHEPAAPQPGSPPP